MSKVEITINDEGYKVRACNFVIAEDLYMFFRFESPKSDCEIAIAYDEFVNGGDWYVNNGTFAYGNDVKLVEEILFYAIGNDLRFIRLYAAINAAIDEFNKSNR